MHVSIMQFIGTKINLSELEGKRVLEVGSYNVNGGVGGILKNWGKPAEYIGADIEEGPGVDIVCNAENLIDKFGENSFDFVISVEMMEHVRDWQKVILNLKGVCKSGGIIVITTRSKGFKFHAYPHDYWRFEKDDMEAIFSDCEILTNDSDWQDPGVLLKVRKPENFIEKDLSDYSLYNMLTDSKTLKINEEDFKHSNYRKITAKRKRKELRKRFRRFKKRILSIFK